MNGVTGLMRLQARGMVLALLLVLGFAVPAMLVDLECLLGAPGCCACQDGQQPPDDCSSASLAAMAVPAPDAPPRDLAGILPVPTSPQPTTWVAPADERAPRDGPPPLATGLRAPPA